LLCIGEFFSPRILIYSVNEQNSSQMMHDYIQQILLSVPTSIAKSAYKYFSIVSSEEDGTVFEHVHVYI